MHDIVTLTANPTIDIDTAVGHVVPEQKLRCERPSYEPGGGGVNVARAVTKLGGEALALLAQAGDAGRLLERLLEAEHVATTPIPVAGETRQNLIVLDRASGQQYRFGLPGPELGAADAERCLEALAALDPPPNLLVLSGSLPPGFPEDFYARAIRRAAGSTRVVVDTSGPALHATLGSGAYLLKPNLRELQQLVERSLESDEAIHQAADELVRRGHAEVVVVSLGAAGALLVDAQHHVFIRAPTVPIRSKVGAGDSTVAGIVLGLARGKTLDDAVRLGVAAGAAAVMTDGSQLCRRPDVDRLYAQLTST